MIARILRATLLIIFTAAMIVAIATLHVNGLTLLGAVAGIGWFIMAGGFAPGFWVRGNQH